MKGIAIILSVASLLSGCSQQQVEESAEAIKQRHAKSSLEAALRCEKVLTARQAKSHLETLGARHVAILSAATPNSSKYAAGLYSEYVLPVNLSLRDRLTSNRISIERYAGDSQRKAFGLTMLLGNDEPIEMIAKADGGYRNVKGDYRKHIGAHDRVFRREGNHQYAGCQFYYRTTAKWIDSAISSF